MLIQHKKTGSRGMFFVEEDGEIEAEMIYFMPAANEMIIERTVIDADLRGQDIGYALVHKAVDYARTHGIVIRPVDPFAKSVFDKKPDFRDVVV
ncbi:GNAT family N-acetyltransferase [Paraflavisolibacter sp. H34]|uniref:GNAT family N-acetyltransferase n=1 Tax=Huijunlia imazamoxiresistens TaxID=3127457 RepID=UPI00301A5065